MKLKLASMRPYPAPEALRGTRELLVSAMGSVGQPIRVLGCGSQARPSAPAQCGHRWLLHQGLCGNQDA